MATVSVDPEQYAAAVQEVQGSKLWRSTKAAAVIAPLVALGAGTAAMGLNASPANTDNMLGWGFGLSKPQFYGPTTGLGILFGSTLGKLAGSWLGGNVAKFGIYGGIIGGLAGFYTGVRMGKNVYMSGVGPNTADQTQVYMSGSTYASLAKTDALRRSLARLSRPIRGMGY